MEFDTILLLWISSLLDQQKRYGSKKHSVFNMCQFRVLDFFDKVSIKAKYESISTGFY